MAQAWWEEVVVTALACALRLYRALELSLLLHKDPQGLPRGCITLRLSCFWSGWLARQTIVSFAAKPAEMRNCREYLMQENCRAYSFGNASALFLSSRFGFRGRVHGRRVWIWLHASPPSRCFSMYSRSPAFPPRECLEYAYASLLTAEP